MRRKRLALVIGTRPEAIKLAPIFLAAQKSEQFDVKVVLTGQHRQMLDQAISQFGLRVDVDLDIMKPDQTLCDTTVAAMDGLHRTFRSLEPDCVIVQGDTSTTFCGALAAFYLRIPVAHVEAGLRTGDLSQPFPEEGNRLLTSADWRTSTSRRRSARRRTSLRENVRADRIWVTGNTAIDALFYTLEKAGRRTNVPAYRAHFAAHRSSP